MIFERKPCFLDPLNKKLHDLTDINIYIRFKFLIFQRIFNLTVAVKNISVFSEYAGSKSLPLLSHVHYKCACLIVVEIALECRAFKLRDNVKWYHSPMIFPLKICA